MISDRGTFSAGHVARDRLDPSQPSADHSPPSGRPPQPNHAIPHGYLHGPLVIPLVIPPEIIPGIPITLHALRAKPTPGIMKKTILMASILALVTLSSQAQFS